MNYQNLEQNIIDVIKEEQAKLGYRLEEIRLYYPLSSVNHLLNTTGSAEETLQSLADFGAFTADRLGVVTAILPEGTFLLLYSGAGESLRT